MGVCRTCEGATGITTTAFQHGVRGDRQSATVVLYAPARNAVSNSPASLYVHTSVDTPRFL